MTTIDQNERNRVLASIQAQARSLGITDDITALTPERRQELISLVEAQVKREKGGGINSRIAGTMQDVGDIWSQGKHFTFSPQTGEVGAVDVGVKSDKKQPSAFDELIQYEKLKTLQQERTKIENEKEREQAILKAKKDIYENTGATPITATPTDISPKETPIETSMTAPPQKKLISTLPTGELFEYDNPNYEAEKAVWDLQQKEKETTSTKIIESDVKKLQLSKDLESFFAVDNLIDRAKGGFIPTRIAGLTSQTKAIAQPVNKETGQPEIKGTAARVHDAARKRLRVQLVRAAGDVGNINIVEQEAAEKLIPDFYDSQQSAEFKRAYLTEVSRAINNNDPNAVKEALKKAGVGFIENKPTKGANTENKREQYNQLREQGLSKEEAKRRLGL